MTEYIFVISVLEMSRTRKCEICRQIPSKHTSVREKDSLKHSDVRFEKTETESRFSAMTPPKLRCLSDGYKVADN